MVQAPRKAIGNTCASTYPSYTHSRCETSTLTQGILSYFSVQKHTYEMMMYKDVHCNIFSKSQKGATTQVLFKKGLD